MSITPLIQFCCRFVAQFVVQQIHNKLKQCSLGSNLWTSPQDSATSLQQVVQQSTTKSNEWSMDILITINSAMTLDTFTQGCRPDLIEGGVFTFLSPSLTFHPPYPPFPLPPLPSPTPFLPFSSPPLPLEVGPP